MNEEPSQPLHFSLFNQSLISLIKRQMSLLVSSLLKQMMNGISLIELKELINGREREGEWRWPGEKTYNQSPRQLKNFSFSLERAGQDNHSLHSLFPRSARLSFFLFHFISKRRTRELTS